MDVDPDGDQVLGSAGQALAVQWYEGEGYEILERNWSRREGEISLIARRGRTVAFCEVVTGSPDAVGRDIEAVLPAKQRRIRRLGARWLTELTPAAGRSLVDLRFDVAVATGGEIDIVLSAF